MREKLESLETKNAEQFGQISHLTTILTQERQWNANLEAENQRLRQSLLDTQTLQVNLIKDMGVQANYNSLYNEYQKLLCKIPEKELEKTFDTKMPSLSQFGKRIISKAQKWKRRPEMLQKSISSTKTKSGPAEQISQAPCETLEEHSSKPRFLDESSEEKDEQTASIDEILQENVYISESPRISPQSSSLFLVWDTIETCSWLRDIGFPQYIRNFETEEISGAVLTELDDEDLQELEITEPLHRKEILNKIQEMVILPSKSVLVLFAGLTMIFDVVLLF